VEPNGLLRMAVESSTRHAICNGVRLDTNSLPPRNIRALVVAARREPRGAAAVRQPRCLPKPAHELPIRLRTELTQRM
jgi:hypothetical protein